MKQVRISKMSEPAKVASSVLFILEGGENAEASALGLSAAVLMKASALVHNLNMGRISIQYIPSMEVITDSFGEPRSLVKMQFLLQKNGDA